jgi:hypothetical protein
MQCHLRRGLGLGRTLARRLTKVGYSVARRFVEENVKHGLDLRTHSISSIPSVADTLRLLGSLPDGLNVPHIVLEAGQT